jgi:hypothetical protein
MANPLDANELIKQGQTRTFYQPGGPGTDMYFFGLDTSYHFIDSAEMPSNGTIDPVYVPDPRRPTRYKLVARQIGAPDLPSVSLIFHEQWGGIPRMLMAPKCEFNLYEVHSRCADLSDFYRGWDSYVLIYSGFRFEAGIDLGARTAVDSDEGLTAKMDAKGAAIYPVGSLGFGEEAASSTGAGLNVVDIVYGSSVTCGDCGIENDGSQFVYAVLSKSSYATSGNITMLYSINGGNTWTSSTIASSISNAGPVFVDIAGSVIFVGVHTGGTTAITATATSIYYTTIDPLTGELGSWSTLAAGSVLLTDVWVKSSRSIWFSATNNLTTPTVGSIYKTTDVTAAPSLIDNGFSNVLTRISGSGDTIVAVGGVAGTSGAIRYTKNGGATWTTVITGASPSYTSLTSITDSFTSVYVIDDRVWYIGGNDAWLVHTHTGGASWVIAPIPGSGTAGYSISDIVFPTREVAWIAYNTGTVGTIYTTIDGGNTFVAANATSRVAGWANFSSPFSVINRIAVPTFSEPAVAANYVTLGGLDSAGSPTGLIVAAAPTIV